MTEPKSIEQMAEEYVTDLQRRVGGLHDGNIDAGDEIISAFKAGFYAAKDVWMREGYLKAVEVLEANLERILKDGTN